MTSTRDKIKKADDRALVLAKKYPFVFALVAVVGYGGGRLIEFAVRWAF